MADGAARGPEIGQAPVDSQTDASSSPPMFCQNLVNIQTPFLEANESLLAAAPSPIPTQGDTLFTFMASRLASSFDNLGGKDFGLTQPVTMVFNGAGAVTEATEHRAADGLVLTGGGGPAEPRASVEAGLEPRAVR